tara:strand:+ start:180 stop:527 length:348 start_codon:yes stop_codon:yes gene_type:complete
MTYHDVVKLFVELMARADKIFKNKGTRHYTVGKILHEQRTIIYIDRETQTILLKMSIDIRYKKVLEKDAKLLDIFSQDATIEELVKQTDSCIKLEECLLAFRESERGTAVYNRLT